MYTQFADKNSFQIKIKLVFAVKPTFKNNTIKVIYIIQHQYINI
jgi:hypothetical protein